MRRVLGIVSAFLVATGVCSCEGNATAKNSPKTSSDEGKPSEEVGLKIWPLTQEYLNDLNGQDIEAIRVTFGDDGEQSKFLGKTRVSYYASFQQWKSAKDGDLIGVDFYFDDNGKMVRWAGEYFAGSIEDVQE